MVLLAIAGSRPYQVIGLWIERSLAKLWGLGSGVVVAVPSGEEALDDAFEAGHALGQGLDVLPHVGQAGINFRAQTLIIRAEFGSHGLAVRAEFSAQGLVVGARVAAKGDQQADDGRADGEDADEFGGRGRLLGVGLLIHRPWGSNGSTDRGARDCICMADRQRSALELVRRRRRGGRGALVGRGSLR